MRKHLTREARSTYARRLDQAPLRAKVAVLVLGSAVGGALVGMIEANLGHPGWVLMLGMVLVAGAMVVLGQWWLTGPFDRLMGRLDKLADRGTAVLKEDLPTRREDEVGRIATKVHRIMVTARQHDQEARRLRRTMDHRVEHATRKATSRLRELAMRDGLTGLGNRRFLDEQLPELVAAVGAADDDLVCVLMDLDNFKQVNDELGHAAGDEVLIVLGELIRGAARDTDVAARLGGDEFVLLMPGADADRGRELADRLRKLFHQRTRGGGRPGPFADVSAGVAALVADACTTGAGLLERADAHLYEAKRGGKGRTFVGRRAA